MIKVEHTNYPIEEKMYTKQQMIDFVNQFLQDEALDDVDFEEWFEQNAK